MTLSFGILLACLYIYFYENSNLSAGRTVHNNTLDSTLYILRMHHDHNFDKPKPQ